MADTAALEAQLEALKAARRSGVSSAGYGDKRTEFRSDEELQAAIASLEAEIAGAEGKRPQLIVARSTKGY